MKDVGRESLSLIGRNLFKKFFEVTFFCQKKNKVDEKYWDWSHE